MATAGGDETRASEELRSVIRDALAVRDRWSAFFNGVVAQPDLGDPELHARVLSVAGECRAALTGCRARLRELHVPSGTAPLAGRIDALIWRYILICEAAEKITPPVTREALGRIGDLMREASGSVGFDGVGGEVSLFRMEGEGAEPADEAAGAPGVGVEPASGGEPAAAAEAPGAAEAAQAGPAAEADRTAEAQPAAEAGPAAEEEPPGATVTPPAKAGTPAAAQPPVEHASDVELEAPVATGEVAAAAASGERVSLTRARAAVGAAPVGEAPSAVGSAAARPRRRVGAPAGRRAAAGISVALVLVVGAAALAWTMRPAPGPPTPTPLAFVTTARTTNDLRLRVLDEVRARGLPLADVDVRLLPPDRIGIFGTIARPEGPEPIELQYRLGVGADGTVLATPVDLVALNPDLKPPPPELEAALGEVSRGLAPVPPEGQVLRRVVVLPDAVSGEFRSATP